MVGVVCQLEAEERVNADRLVTTTEELEKARLRIRSMKQAIEEARTKMAKLVIEGPKQSQPVALVSVQQNKTSVTEIVPDTNKAQELELTTLKKELAAQEALRAREREWKKVEEEKQRKTAESLRQVEESLRKGHQAYDRLKEEKDKV